MGKLLLGEISDWGSCCWGKLVTEEVSVGKISGWGSCDCVNCFGEVALGKHHVDQAKVAGTISTKRKKIF